MRASILLWSTASGLILGLFVDAILIGMALLFSSLIPSITARVAHRWFLLAATGLLAVIPLVLALLGYLEGKLKTV